MSRRRFPSARPPVPAVPVLSRGAALLGLALAALAAPPALAQAMGTAAVQRQQYDIAPGSLDQVLGRFAAAAGIVLSADGALTQGKQSPGLQGSYSVDEALARLLAGQGLEEVRGANGVYSLRRQPAARSGEATLPLVAVKAGAEEGSLHLGQKISAGALGSRRQLETPLSTTIVTREDLAERQVSKLGDVFALDASVTDNSGAYSSWASYVTVRGLELDWQNSYRIDGKPFLSYAITLPYEHFEQVELLKGASGFLYGFGSPGGLINYATKKPTDFRLTNVEVGFKSGGVWSEGLDLGGRFGNDDMFGYRFNAVNEQGKTFNDGRIDRQSYSLALDARVTRDLTLTFDSLYQKRRSEGQTPSINIGGLTGNVLPGTVAGESRDYLSGGQFLNTEFSFYSTGLKYQLAPDWVASANYSRSTSSRSRNESILYLSDAAGNYNEFRSDTREGHHFSQWQAMLEGKVRTGVLEHQLVFGTSWQKQTNDYSRNGAWVSLGAGNLFTANGASYSSQGGINLYRAGDILQKAVFASDTVKLSERWSVLGGLRQTRYEQNDYNVNGSSAGRYSDSVVTPTLALMYQAAPNTMAYASYMESLEPGKSVGVGYTNYGHMLDPMVSKQLEVGIKTEQERWSGTAALFRIERASEYANTAGALVNDGEAAYQGLEVGGGVRLGSQWLLEGNLMLLNASYEKGPAASQGKRVAGAPELMATARLSYKVPQVAGLKLMADAKYTGDVMADTANRFNVPAHTLYNLGASYSTKVGNYPTTLRAVVNNLSNERFWEFQYAGYIKPADPRSLSLSAQFEF